MIAASTDGLATVFRQEVDDPLEGTDSGHPDSECLWKNVEVYQYMTEAADKVAKKVEGWYQVIQLAVQPAVQSVPLAPWVLHIREARLLTALRRLEPSEANVAMHYKGDDYGERLSGTFWSTSGVPTTYVRDYEASALLLFPIPTDADTLELQCTVTISTPLGEGMKVPYCDPEDQRLMLHYMKKLAYEKQDADTLDLKRAQQFEQQFESSAANRQSRLRSYRRRPGFVQMDW